MGSPAHFKAQAKSGRGSNKIAYIGSLVVILLAIVPLLYLARYSHVSADDLAYGKRVHTVLINSGLQGIALVQAVLGAAWDTTVFFYNNWSGSYTGVFVQAMQPGVFNENLYWITTVCMLGAIYLGFLMTCKLVFTRLMGVHDWKVYLLAGIGACMATVTMPDTMQGLYWFNGAFGYTLMWGVGMFTVYLASGLVMRASKSRWRVVVRLVLTSICAFIVAGGGHVPAFMTILMLFVISVYSIIRKRNWLPLIPLLVCCAGFLVVMSAPGTNNRAKTLVYFNGESSVTWTLMVSAQLTIAHFREWTKLSLLFMLLAATPVIWALYDDVDFDINRINILWVLLTILATILLVGAELCVPLYAMHWEGEGRLTDMVYFTYVSGMFTSWILLCGVLKRRSEAGSGWLNRLEGIAHKPLAQLVFPALLLVVVIAPVNWPGFLESNMRIALRELRYSTAQDFDAEMDAKVAELSDPNKPVVTIKPLQHWSRLLSYSDYADPQWVADVTEYYQKEQVIVDTSGSN